MPSPYPNLETIVTETRVRINDAIFAGGQTLTDTAPITLPTILLGWRRLQQFLVGQGFTTQTAETIISAVAAVTNLDPGVFQVLSWTTTPALPGTMIRPLTVWERPYTALPSPVNVPGVFREMDYIPEGIEAVPKGTWNRQWDWTADQLRMPGARMVTDFRIRYAQYFPDFVAAAVMAFAAQTVPILNCESALSGAIAAEFCSAREDTDVASLVAMWQQDAMLLVSTDSIEGRQVKKDSERSKMKDRYSGGGPS
jgi:hypothetical protein